VYISYRCVQLVGMQVLIFGKFHTTVLGGMRWCVIVPRNGSGSIRLVDLEAGEDEREIRCFLEEWDPDNNPS
jgi:hypothetical protein